MIKVLICLEDKVMTDVVKTAFKQFPNMTAYPVPVHKLLDLLSTPDSDYHAVVIDLDKRGGEKGLIPEIRRTNSSVEIITIGERAERERFNRVKVDLNIFSCITVPVDPFELARRIVRLERHLTEKNPLAI